MIAVLLAAACQCADTDYKVYVEGETGRFDEDNGKCLDMKGNLLLGKAEVRDTLEEDGGMVGFLCMNGEQNEERGYYNSGALKYIEPYKNGKVEGVFKFFYESGKLKYGTPYKNGKAEGIEKSFYEIGKLKSEISYKNGKRERLAKFFYENGELERKIMYKNGAQEGETKVFRENGEIWGVFTYKNDKAISGVCHKTNGETRPFTKVELENWDNKLGGTCE
ncbi:MAG: toxin-antitoxin system YwqK family antitoxin [Helicobacteraceae bacterium]|nr:toxin-antitoxin system YwqK family antitoxin [Helicobacteraceae bacterium]